MMHDNVQTMTSLEIAELTGKQHKNLMQAIRKMEPAWEKVQGLKFQLSSRVYNLPNGGTKGSCQTGTSLAGTGAHEAPLRRSVSPILHQEYPQGMVRRMRYR